MPFMRGAEQLRLDGGTPDRGVLVRGDESARRGAEPNSAGAASPIVRLPPLCDKPVIGARMPRSGSTTPVAAPQVASAAAGGDFAVRHADGVRGM